MLFLLIHPQCQVHHDDDGGVGSGAGGLNPQYEEISKLKDDFNSLIIGIMIELFN